MEKLSIVWTKSKQELAALRTATPLLQLAQWHTKKGCMIPLEKDVEVR
jgi:hypothetical protein